MTIGINAAAAFIRPRTGVEEYVYQLIKALTTLEESQRHHFILFSPSKDSFDFKLPVNFEIRKLSWSLPLWTQARLATEMFFRKPEILFIPVHILPLIHPENSVVTIHGLEYEYFPKTYSRKHLAYLKWSAAHAVKKAEKIIAVSESTKNDLIRFCGAKPERIAVVYHGIAPLKIKTQNLKREQNIICKTPTEKPFFLFLGRLEEKKNILGIIKAFELLKKKYQLPHKLILAGASGYGFKKIKSEINSSKFKDDIIESGYICEQDKWRLLEKTEALVFPSFYEGFGLPILEAQASGCPVITSDVSSLPEVAGDGAILIKPEVEQIYRAMYKIIDDVDLRKRLIDQGYQNVKKFSWRKCARKTLKELLS